MDTEKTRLDIIRHGEHVLGEVVCGVTDPDLTTAGWNQMKSTIDQLVNSGLSWDLCVTSPRVRCAGFAKSMAEELSMKCAVMTELAEVDFGEWEAMAYTEINSRFPGQWMQWIHCPDEAAPHGGEAYGQFLNRIDVATKNLIEQFRGKRILCFAHAGVIRALLYSVLKLERLSLSGISVPHGCHSSVLVYHSPEKADWYQMHSHNTFAAKP